MFSHVIWKFLALVFWFWLWWHCGCYSKSESLTSEKENAVCWHGMEFKEENQWNFSLSVPEITTNKPYHYACLTCPRPQAYIKPTSSEPVASNRRHSSFQTEFLRRKRDLRWFMFQERRSSPIVETWIQSQCTHPLTKTRALWQETEAGRGLSPIITQRIKRIVVCRHKQRKPIWDLAPGMSLILLLIRHVDLNLCNWFGNIWQTNNSLHGKGCQKGHDYYWIYN